MVREALGAVIPGLIHDARAQPLAVSWSDWVRQTLTDIVHHFIAVGGDPNAISIVMRRRVIG